MKLNKTQVLTLLGAFFFAASTGAAQYGDSQAAAETDFKWPPGKRLALSLSFDDARASQLDNGIPILNKHGVKATFYVHPDRVAQRLDEWKQAVAAGHELGNHSNNHPCSGNFLWARERALENHTLESIANELDSASAALERLLGFSPATFAYPCGQKFVGRGEGTRSYVSVVAKKFLAGRGWLNEAPNDPSFVDLAQLFGMEMDGLSFAQARQLIDAAETQGGWLVFAGHDVGTGGRQTVLMDTLDAVCAYAKDPANGVWIGTVEEIARYVQKNRSALD